MRSLLFAVLSLCVATPGFCWGPEAHKIVAFLAARNLSPDVVAQVNRLLAIDNFSEAPQGLADVSGLADMPCPQPFLACRTDVNRFWHFTDIPIAADGYDRSRDCVNPSGDDQCSVEQIQRMVAVLQDPTATQQDQAQALEFLVHFVGDLHQPLHSSDNNDEGGNLLKIQFLNRCSYGSCSCGGPQCMNLHRIWDTDMVRDLLGCGSTCTDGALSDYADNLAAGITDDQFAQWSMGLPSDWANESHNAARDVSYANLPLSCAAGGTCSTCSTVRCGQGCTPCVFEYVLTNEYEDAVRDQINTQMQRAGVRLATLLNSAFQP